jgi:hypothetical protein
MARCRVLSAASFSRNQNNSDKSRSVDNSACSDALAVPLSNSGRSATQSRDREQSSHLTIAALLKRLGGILVHSSCRNYQQQPVRRNCNRRFLSDLSIFAKFDFPIFDFALGGG